MVLATAWPDYKHLPSEPDLVAAMRGKLIVDPDRFLGRDWEWDLPDVRLTRRLEENVMKQARGSGCHRDRGEGKGLGAAVIPRAL